jgi:acetyl/propionyl-CoA carboxylase alpha subunit
MTSSPFPSCRVIPLIPSFSFALQVSGLSNNIDFLVQIVRHPGFHSAQPTTAFFDQYMTDIMGKLNAPSSSETGVVSLHTVFGLVAQSFQLRTPVCESPRMTAFEPFNASTCGNWRTVGGVKNVIQTSTENIQVETSGDSFVFTALPPADAAHGHSHGQKKKGEHAAAAPAAAAATGLQATVVSVRKILANNSYESVWEISLEINGQRRSATVTCFRSGSVGSMKTEIDGESPSSPSSSVL